MKKELNKISNEIDKHGKKLCKSILLPSVKKWMKKNKFKAMYFINGRGWVENEKGETIWPSDMNSVKIANEFIDLSNAVGYDRGFDLPETIKI